jgi:NarL family two-component system response regulator LiaR
MNMNTNLIRVLLVDDHPVVRSGIKGELSQAADVVLLGEAGTGYECLRLADELHPDLVLLDMVLPDLDGVEVTQRLLEKVPQTRILVFSGYMEDAFIFGVLEAGAQGYLLKDEMLDLVVDGVRAAARGEIVFSDRVAQRLAHSAFDENTRREKPSLTGRETEVLKLVAAFRTNDEIAAELTISCKTVEYHLANILAKLGVHTRREAARWAWTDESLQPPLPQSDPSVGVPPH